METKRQSSFSTATNDKEAVFLKRMLSCKPQDRQTRHDRPKQDAAILQLPVELILEIATQLPRQSLYTLAQTCYPLQAILRHHFHLEAADALQQHVRSLDILSCYSTDLLNRLVCNRCVEFHVAEYQHLPRGVWREYQLNTMQIGCKRLTDCLLICCHPPHLCSCHRTSSPMAYVQKQHIELVLNYADPSLRYDVGMLRMTIPPQRMASSIRCGLHCKPQLPRPYTTIHHKIMTRVVQGRFLLHREIRWSNGGEDRPDAVLSMHMSRCIARGNGETASHLQFNWRDLFFDQNDYGLVLKCPYCMSECNVAGTHESGIFRLWQDLGGEEDTGGHQCFLDMVPDHDRARTEAGRISRLFGPA